MCTVALPLFIQVLADPPHAWGYVVFNLLFFISNFIHDVMRMFFVWADMPLFYILADGVRMFFVLADMVLLPRFDILADDAFLVLPCGIACKMCTIALPLFI